MVFSHHVKGNETCLRNVQSILPHAIMLPNGEQALTIKEGCVFLDVGLILKHVLLVPKLNCNLNSVSQMIDDLHNYV